MTNSRIAAALRHCGTGATLRTGLFLSGFSLSAADAFGNTASAKLKPTNAHIMYFSFTAFCIPARRIGTPAAWLRKFSLSEFSEDPVEGRLIGFLSNSTDNSRARQLVDSLPGHPSACRARAVRASSRTEVGSGAFRILPLEERRATERAARRFLPPSNGVSQSQRLRGMSYPGWRTGKISTPTGLRDHSPAEPQPRWGLPACGPCSQGGSCRATLGFQPESRWDSSWEFPPGIKPELRNEKSAPPKPAAGARRSRRWAVRLAGGVPVPPAWWTWKRPEGRAPCASRDSTSAFGINRHDCAPGRTL